MEAALSTVEKLLQEDLKKGREAARETAGIYAPAMLMMPQMSSASALASGATVLQIVPLGKTSEAFQRLLVQHNELSNAITLRGIVALEAGNTEFARILFKRALDEAGDAFNFTERPIARRYLELLDEQKR
jgi:hypothetical protein